MFNLYKEEEENGIVSNVLIATFTSRQLVEEIIEECSKKFGNVYTIEEINKGDNINE